MSTKADLPDRQVVAVKKSQSLENGEVPNDTTSSNNQCMFLVYECMERGCSDNHEAIVLDWRRLSAIKAVASAPSFLHRQWCFVTYRATTCF